VRSIEDIIASTQTTTEASLREAFEAGRAHATTDLKSKMTAFFDGLLLTGQTHDEPHPAPAEPEHHPEPVYHPEPDHQTDGNYQSNEPHY